MKQIAILGAGFGGPRTALLIGKGLIKHRLTNTYEVVLIDKNDRHTYTPLLYEIATTLEVVAGYKLAVVHGTVASRGDVAPVEIPGGGQSPDRPVVVAPHQGEPVRLMLGALGGGVDLPLAGPRQSVAARPVAWRDR